jgi:hypothetical protein
MDETRLLYSTGGGPTSSINPVRLYAGQADPTDPSHFTIEYATEKVAGVWDHGVVDGWLRDNDTLALKFRPGPAREAFAGR